MRAPLRSSRRTAPPRGLHLNPPKSLVHCPSYPVEDEFPLGQGIERVRGGGIKVLGSPVGNEEYSRGFLEAKIASLEELLAKIHLLQDAHCEQALLRSCFSFPKLSYLVRTVPPAQHTLLFERFDRGVRAAAEGIIGAPFSDTEWLQATLPSGVMGGAGLRSAASHAPAAYLVSVSSADDIIREITGGNPGPGEAEAGAASQSPHFAQALALLNERVQDPYTPETISVTRQKVVSHAIDSFTHQQLAASLEGDRDIARLNSLGVLGAGDWLNCVPPRRWGCTWEPGSSGPP